MKVFNDPDNITTLTVDALPDPAMLGDKTLKAICAMNVTLGPNPAINDDAVEERVDEWYLAVVKEDALRHPHRVNKLLRR
jgi:hypothetical protein